MRGFHLVLLAGLQLCAARQPGFSIHDDLLAHPQFEVVFSDSYILEKDALLIFDAAIRREAAAKAYHPDSTTSQTDLANPAAESAAASSSDPHADINNAGGGGSGTVYGNADDATDGSAQVSETFEIMNVPPSRYLCSIPVLAPPAPLNQTATELARAEENREISRMSDRGIDIISRLQGECMYYVSGWWSYSFCYGKEIVQFHALTTKTGKPVKDPQSQEYILGRMQGQAAAYAANTNTNNNNNNDKTARTKGDVDVQKPLDGNTDGAGSGKAANDPYNTQLQIKGDQRYMVQRLGAGTICDLTGRERTIEVQYHCNPGGTGDRISWIKEVTTCAYLMEVRTPRLCEEAAFLPPKPTRAHPISCRLIVRSEEEASSQWHQQKLIDGRADTIGNGVKTPAGGDKQRETDPNSNLNAKLKPGEDGIVIGGIVVGARKALGRGESGHPPLNLEPPKYFGRDGGELAKGGRVIKILARAKSKANGGEVMMLPNEELLKYDLSHDQIRDLVGQLVENAKGMGWRLEAVEHPGVPTLEFRAILEPDDEVDGDDNNHNNHNNHNNKVDGDKIQPAKPEEKKYGAEAQGTDTQTVTEAVTVTVAKADAATNVPVPDGGGDDDEGSEETFKKDEL